MAWVIHLVIYKWIECNESVMVKIESIVVVVVVVVVVPLVLMMMLMMMLVMEVVVDVPLFERVLYNLAI